MNPELEKLITSGRLVADAAQKLSELEVGAHCLHRSWGVGKVAGWDLLGDRLTIDFEDKKGHEMKLEFAAKSLDPLDATHVLSRRLDDPEGLAAAATESPEEFVRDILVSYGGTLSLDRFEDIVKGKVIPEGKFKGWWDAAKRKLRADRRFVVPPKRTEPLELRDEDISPSKAMVNDFLAARDLKAKAKAAGMILKDISAFENPEAELEPVAKEMQDTISKALKINPSQVVELILARQALFEECEALKSASVAEGEDVGLVEILRQERPRLRELLTSMAVAPQRKLYAAFPEAYGDEWVSIALEQMNRSGSRGVVEITRFLISSGGQSELETFLKTGIKHRSLGADVVVWLCKERKGAAVAHFDPELASCLLQVMERDYYDEEASRNSRLHDTVLNDAALVPELMEICDIHQARNFARRVLASPVFEELNRRSLLARIIKIHPEVGDLVSGDGDDDEAKLIVSWDSLEERKKAYDKLVQVDVPENIREIQIAREHGDLRENAEYKAAKEMQAVLMRLQTEMEKELANARGMDFNDVENVSVVSIGTSVEIEDLADGSRQNYSILGAWDTDLNKNIISYLSGTGDALLGKAEGEEVSLPTEENDVTRTVKVVSIKRYVDA